MASTYLTIDSQAGNTSTWTWSGWVKRGELSTSQVLFGAGTVSDSFIYVRFRVEDTLQLYQELGGVTTIDLQTSQVFRDTSAWYHIVVAFDDTQATTSDRVKFYVNGSQITSFGTSTYPGQNDTTYFNNSTNRPFHLGARSFDQTNIYDGSMSHVHWIDGTQYSASDFGETDATTGIWKIKTSPSVTYGTNGFFILKDGNSVTDQSGNGNNFTVAGGTLTNTEDCPSNVFCTWNPLVPPASSNHSFENGNTTVRGTTSANVDTAFSTFAVSSGKWYCEMKLTQEGNATSSVPNFGIGSTADFKNAPDEAYYDTSGVNLYVGRVNSTQINHNGSAEGTSFSTAYDVGDIVGLALDLDSGTKTLKFYLNGTLNATININADEYCFICAVKRDDNDAQVDANFGNGYFGTTAVSSAGTNASGNGIFEYDVPTGYTALSTKGLNL